MNTMEFSLYVLSVIALAQVVYSQPGAITDATLTFSCPLRPGGVNYPEHDLFAAGVHVHNVQHVVFNAKGKNDAHILLKKDRHNYHGNVVEIVLGGWGNSQSVIRDVQQGRPAKAIHRGQVMNEPEYRTFWASWIGRCIKVGKGHRVGERQMMAWCGNNHPINYISASFGFGSGGLFQFLKTATELSFYSVFRPGGVDYPKHDLFADGIDISSSKSVVFTTQGRNDAHVLLKQYQNNYHSNVIEVVFGGWGNTQSVIRNRQQGPNKATNSENKPLSAAEKRYFWISWESNCIRVGKGYSVGKRQMMSWCGMRHAVNYISASYGFGSDGYFQFTRTAGAP